ncbi:MAG: hypothetical protein ABR501_14285 [Pyrinomonadaceae bacterium]
MLLTLKEFTKVSPSIKLARGYLANTFGVFHAGGNPDPRVGTLGWNWRTPLALGYRHVNGIFSIFHLIARA